MAEKERRQDTHQLFGPRGEVKDGKVELTWKDAEGEMQSETFDKVLVTVGRRPIHKDGAREMGLRMDADGDLSESKSV
ncbi:MAG: hypothetical protein Ct9H90mP16_13030 [Candidatus Poseidoniales archaeon]|nr:MAG: hypothetical protein Ct9H90mP16_13030 [Candidatus Poseidoniales archaeon]